MRDGSASIGIKKIAAPSDFEGVKENKQYIYQPFIDGTEYGVDVYFDMISGELVSVFMKKKIAMRAGETDKAKRKCRFCRESMPTVKFDKDAHTISEGLGNKSIITNENLQTGFYMREMGLYATDPDDKTIGIKGFRVLGADAVANFDVFDLTGKKVSSFTARNIHEAKKLWRENPQSRNVQGVCIIRNRYNGAVAKVRTTR